MTSYGQFCPVAKAMEVLDERWTILVIRELLQGSHHFNELRRGVPKMSPALLSKRLRTLERAGLVRRSSQAGRVAYSLTPAGQELGPIVDSIGLWSLRWIHELGEQDLDPHLLLWDMRRTVPIETWPRARTVVHFRFGDVPSKDARWWMVVSSGEVDVCDVDPGFDVAATVQCDLRTLISIWGGASSWAQTVRTGDLVVEAPAAVRRELPAWIGQSRLAQLAAAS